MLAIRLPEDLEKRLEALAKRTGRTKTYYVREAIVEHLDDLEDLYLAEARLEALRRGDDYPRPLEEVGSGSASSYQVADASVARFAIGEHTVTCRQAGDSIHLVVAPKPRRSGRTERTAER